MKPWTCLPLLLGLAANIFADGLIVIHEPVAVPRGHYPFAPLEVTYHHVNVKIEGQLATTSIDQEFYNPNHQRLEGTYLFPVPKGAQLNKFTMDIGGKQVEAELLPADKARKIYEDIVRKMRDPALLEYADRDTFKVRIYPIEPRSPKRITLSYTQVLKSDAGLVSFVYPLNTEKFSAKPIKTVSLKVELETKRPLKSIYSPSHTVEIKRHGAHRAIVGFESNDVRPDTDFQLLYATRDDDVGLSLMTYRDEEDEGYFLLLASPGVETKGAKIIPKDVAFVLDTSGSMAGSKLAQAKKALQFCVENLNDGDRFEIVRFSTEVEPLFEKLVEANKENRRRAGEFIEKLKPIGGTAIEEALLKSLDMRSSKGDRPFVVIFLTDGRPTIGNTDEDQIVATVNKATGGNTRIFCFGIGMDVNTHLLDKITEATRAFSQYVLPDEDLEVKLSSFFSKINAPVLTNVRLRFSGGIKASKMYPSPLPDLYKGEQLVVVGRYAGKGAAAVTIEGDVSGATRKFSEDVGFDRRDGDNDFIARLWATRRIGYLLDEIRLRGESQELRDEVTDLARQFGIVTPYTAYLIVEDEGRRNLPPRTRSFSRLGEDRPALESAGRVYKGFRDEKSGDAALGGARAFQSQKAAESLDSLRFANEEAQRSIAAAPAPALSGPAAREAGERLGRYVQQQRFVRGRAFYQNGEVWVDASAQKMPNAKRVAVQFNSAEYFDLIAKNQHAAAWFALGPDVDIALGDTVYEVRR
jgi:Ca-activated chloride channel family protein